MYKLINKNTNEETICKKLIIDNFDYYVSEGEIKINDPITDNYRIWFWRDDCSLLGRKKVLCSNNPNIDIPKVIENLAVKLGLDFMIQTSNKTESMVAFAYGYDKAKEIHQYTEEDITEFADWYDWTFNSLAYKDNTSKFYKKTHKELLSIWKEQQLKILYYE